MRRERTKEVMDRITSDRKMLKFSVLSVIFLLFESNAILVDYIELAKPTMNKYFNIDQQYEVVSVHNDSFVAIMSRDCRVVIIHVNHVKDRFSRNVSIEDKFPCNEFALIDRSGFSHNSTELEKFFIVRRPYAQMCCNFYSPNMTLIFKEDLYYPLAFHGHGNLTSNLISETCDIISVSNEMFEEITEFYTTSTQLAKCGLSQKSENAINYIRRLGSSLKDLKGVKIDRNGRITVEGRNTTIRHQLAIIRNRDELTQTYTDSPKMDASTTVRTTTEWVTLTERQIDTLRDKDTITSVIFSTVTVDPSTITIFRDPVTFTERLNITHITTVERSQTQIPTATSGTFTVKTSTATVFATRTDRVISNSLRHEPTTDKQIIRSDTNSELFQFKIQQKLFGQIGVRQQ